MSGMASASDFVKANRYNAQGQLTGTISADPDGDGALGHPAVRYKYNGLGLLESEESGTLSSLPAESIEPAAWTGFTAHLKSTYRYDDFGRTIQTIVYSGSTAVSRVDVAYDGLGRVQCEAVRMDPSTFTSNLSLSACTLTAAETADLQAQQTLDRITEYTYNNHDQILTIVKAKHTSLEQTYAAYEYENGVRRTLVTDANDNKAKLEYDSHYRLYRWYFPNKTGTKTYNTSDYEEYHYDDNGNKTYLRKRDGQELGYTYDNLNQVVIKDIPGTTANDVYYGYDLRGLQTHARFGSHTGNGITTAYDGFGRIETSTNNTHGTTRSLGYEYDARSNRTKITHPDDIYFHNSYDHLDRLTHIRENSTDANELITRQYNSKHLLESLQADSSGALTSVTYDNALRVRTFGHDFAAGLANDLTMTFGYNPAGQVTSRKLSNDNYLQAGNDTLTGAYQVNGLNQYTCQGSEETDCDGGKVLGYDDNGNLTDHGDIDYVFDVENRLISVSGGGTAASTLYYDPMGRLSKLVQGGAETHFLYDGDALVAEYDQTGTMTQRYVHGGRIDNPLVAYNGSGIGSVNRNYLHTDHQGSVIAHTADDGRMIQLNAYDEFGVPNLSNQGRFAYTGQIILNFGVGYELFHYKARIYHPKLGRFLQTDPVGYEDQMNLYTYVANDPMTNIDPTGMILLPYTMHTANKGVRETAKTNPELHDSMTSIMEDTISLNPIAGVVLFFTDVGVKIHNNESINSKVSGTIAGEVTGGLMDMGVDELNIKAPSIWGKAIQKLVETLVPIAVDKSVEAQVESESVNNADESQPSENVQGRSASQSKIKDCSFGACK